MNATNQVNKYAVIGLGQFGYAIAKTLTDHGSQVIALDSDAKKIDRITGIVHQATQIDSTNKRTLIAQKIGQYEAVVVAIGKDFEALLLTAVHLKELGVKRIIVRANGDQQRMILQQIGFNEILSPENEVGIAVAERLLNPSILSSLQLRDDYEIVEVTAPHRVLGRSLEELSLRERFNLTVVTIKREFRIGGIDSDHQKYDQRVLGVPSPATIVQSGDTLIVFGKVNDIERFTNG